MKERSKEGRKEELEGGRIRNCRTMGFDLIFSILTKLENVLNSSTLLHRPCFRDSMGWQEEQSIGTSRAKSILWFLDTLALQYWATELLMDHLESLWRFVITTHAQTQVQRWHSTMWFLPPGSKAHTQLVVDSKQSPGSAPAISLCILFIDVIF